MSTLTRKHTIIYLVVLFGFYALTQIFFSQLLASKHTMGDEAYFYQLASNPTKLTGTLWYYGILPPLMASPLATYTSNWTILQLLPIGMSIISMTLVFAITKREVGAFALLFFVPIAIMGRMWEGMRWFYWDPFVIMFFMIALYLERQHKLSYIATCLLVNAKVLVGAFFVLPLALTNRKHMLAWATLIPSFIAIMIITKDPLYIVHKFSEIGNPQSDIYHAVTFWLTTYKWDYIAFMALTLPCVFLVRRYPTYTAFYACALIYALLGGLGMSHTSPVIYAGALVFPLIVHSAVSNWHNWRHSQSAVGAADMSLDFH